MTRTKRENKKPSIGYSAIPARKCSAAQNESSILEDAKERKKRQRRWQATIKKMRSGAL